MQLNLALITREDLERENEHLRCELHDAVLIIRAAWNGDDVLFDREEEIINFLERNDDR